MSAFGVSRDPFFQGGYEVAENARRASNPRERDASSDPKLISPKGSLELQGAPSALEAAVRGGNLSVEAPSTGFFSGYGSLGSRDNAPASRIIQFHQVSVQQASFTRGSRFSSWLTSLFCSRRQGYEVIREDGFSQEDGTGEAFSPQMTRCLREYQNWMREKVHDTREWLGVKLAPRVLEAKTLEELIFQVEGLLPHIGVDVTYYEEEGNPNTGRFLIHKKDMYRFAHRYLCITSQSYQERLGTSGNAVTKMKQLLLQNFSFPGEVIQREGEDPYVYFNDLVDLRDGIINRAVLREFAKNKKVFEFLSAIITRDYDKLDDGIVEEARKNVPPEKVAIMKEEAMEVVSLDEQEKAQIPIPLSAYRQVTKFQKDSVFFRQELEKYLDSKIPDHIQNGVYNMMDRLMEAGVSHEITRKAIYKATGAWGAISFMALASRARALKQADLEIVEKIFNELQGELLRTLQAHSKN